MRFRDYKITKSPQTKFYWYLVEDNISPALGSNLEYILDSLSQAVMHLLPGYLIIQQVRYLDRSYRYLDKNVIDFYIESYRYLDRKLQISRQKVIDIQIESYRYLKHCKLDFEIEINIYGQKVGRTYLQKVKQIEFHISKQKVRYLQKESYLSIVESQIYRDRNLDNYIHKQYLIHNINMDLISLEKVRYLQRKLDILRES